MTELERVVAELAASLKYRTLAPELLRRVARRALLGGGGRDATVKRAKRRLHQLFSAFVAPAELAAIEEIVAGLPAAPDDAALRSACRAILKRHASTRERSEPDAAAYAAIWRVTGAPRRVLDLGCGLHPFALPWMGLPRDCEYVALDVDARLLLQVAVILRALGQRGSASVLDLLDDPDCDDGSDEAAARAALRAPADVAFAQKLLPTLERQREGASLALLQELRARHVVVSFPVASLGGRGKGMEETYRRFLEELLPQLGDGTRVVTEVAAPRETTWIVELPARP